MSFPQFTSWIELWWIYQCPEVIPAKNELGFLLKNRFGQLGQGNGLEFWQLMCLNISDSPPTVFSQQMSGLFYLGSASEKIPLRGAPSTWLLMYFIVISHIMKL